MKKRIRLSTIIGFIAVILGVFVGVGLVFVHQITPALNLEQMKTIATMLGSGGLIACIMLFIVSMKSDLGV